jgi:glutamine synthetase
MQAEREARENVTPSLPGDTLWVRFAFVDHAGIPKAKAVHRDGFGRRAQAGVGLAKGVLALDPSGALHPESGLSPVGECRLVPDLSTLTPLPFASNQAMVACDMTEPDARTPWEGCPRSALKRVLGQLAERGYRTLASYEAEFYIWGSEGPLDRTPYAGSYALTPAAEFVAELARTLQEMGIRPEQCHADAGGRCCPHRCDRRTPRAHPRRRGAGAVSDGEGASAGRGGGHGGGPLLRGLGV